MNMPTITSIIKRLQVHVRGTENADNHKNLADYIWMLRHQSVVFNSDEIWAVLCQEFEDLNTVLNTDWNTSFSRPLVYAINGLLTLCLDFAASQNCDDTIRNLMLQLAWRINAAWDAILAGDIESIEEHVELERVARTI